MHVRRVLPGTSMFEGDNTRDASREQLDHIYGTQLRLSTLQVLMYTSCMSLGLNK